MSTSISKSTPPEEVYFKGFDSVELVSAPKAQVSQFLPVLSRLIVTDAARDDLAVPYWSVPCTRDTLIAVFKSVNAGEIMMHDTASEDDVLAELTRQGAEIIQRFPSIAEPERASGRKRRERSGRSEGRSGSGSGSGGRHTKSEAGAKQAPAASYHPTVVSASMRLLRPSRSQHAEQQRRLRVTCEHIVNSVLRWARLIHAPRPEDGHPRGSFTFTSSRVWIQFLDKPRSMSDARKPSVSTEYLCGRWDDNRWLRDMALALMALRLEACDELKRDGATGDQIDSQNVFNRTAQLVGNHACGPYWSTAFDSGYRSSEVSTLMRLGYVSRARQRIAAQMAVELKGEHTEQEGGGGSVNSQPSEIARQYMALLRREAVSCISPAALFTSDTLDASNTSPERTALEEAFRRHNMRVVMWAEGFDDRPRVAPVLFPPAWHVNSLPTVVDHVDDGRYNPAILLAYGE